MNASLYCSCWLCFTKQELTILTFEIEGANLENDIALKKNGHRIKTPSSKFTILVSSCWEFFFIRNNAHNFFILSLVFLEIIDRKCCILSGPPCISCAKSFFFSMKIKYAKNKTKRSTHHIPKVFKATKGVYPI